MNKKMKRNIIIASAALVVLVAVILVIVLTPSDSGSGSSADIDYGIDMTTSVNADGLHVAAINTNSDGEIENNSYGTLVDSIPAEVEKVVMNTPGGNFTFLVETPVNADGTTEATVYTLEGFEDFDLGATNPSLLIGDLCNVDFVKVADLSGEKAAEYGFEEPRAVGTVYYTDGTYSVVRLGDDAPGGEYSYIQFGDSETVYIVAVDEIDSMLLTFNEFFNVSINSDMTSVSDDDFDRIVLGGTHLEEELVIEANTEESLNCYYVLASHGNMPLDTTEASEIIGTIKCLTTDAVVCVNPDSAQLEEYGLKTPYATVNTTYTYTTSTYDDAGNEIVSDPYYLYVSLLASEEDENGNVYMMEEGGKVIYTIPATSVAWATTSMSQLMSEYVLNPNYFALESIVFETKGKTYDFKLSTETVMASDGSGSATEATEPRVHLDGAEIDPDQFYILFQDLSLMEKGGEDSGTATTGELLKITYNYLTDRESDVVIFYTTDTQKVIPAVNSMKDGYVYQSTISALIENIESVAKDEEINSIA